MSPEDNRFPSIEPDLASFALNHLAPHEKEKPIQKYSDLVQPGIGATAGPPLTVGVKDPLCQ